MEIKDSATTSDDNFHDYHLPTSGKDACTKGQRLTKGVGHVIKFVLRTTDEHNGKTSAGELWKRESFNMMALCPLLKMRAFSAS